VASAARVFGARHARAAALGGKAGRGFVTAAGWSSQSSRPKQAGLDCGQTEVRGEACSSRCDWGMSRGRVRRSGCCRQAFAFGQPSTCIRHKPCISLSKCKALRLGLDTAIERITAPMRRGRKLGLQAARMASQARGLSPAPDHMLYLIASGKIDSRKPKDCTTQRTSLNL